VYYINGNVQEPALLPHPPAETAAETFWRKVAVPAVAAGVGLAFLGQAGAFAKQLLDGEDEFEE